jgi:hypothetical protein
MYNTFKDFIKELDEKNQVPQVLPKNDDFGLGGDG